MTNQNEPVISIKGLHKSFGDLQVLKGVDFTLNKGENVAILGRSGMGKSVLIKIIIGLLKPDKGEVIALGKNIEDLNGSELDKLRTRIGFSFQNSALYDSMNLYQNIAFPLKMNNKRLSKKDIDLNVKRLLGAVGMMDKIDQMPAELSGGQKKRASIARTLILNPEIMLYDEPTAGLDPKTSTEINNMINKVQHQFDTSSIIITHDLTCAKNTSDRIVILHDGKIVNEGTFNDVFNSEEEYLKDFYNYNFIK